MVIKIFIGVFAVLALLAVVISTRPAAFHVERSIAIAAPPESAFTQVNDFHQWATWSPYEKLDPNLSRKYEGAPSGVGAVYSWAGTPKVGEGRMTIEKTDAPSLVSIKLEFFKPMSMTNRATFRFTPTPGGTRVTWAMDGTKNFMSKAFHMIVDMDKLIGGDFERGLATLKANAESTPKANAEATNTAP
jgi:uncharacterized protein YndB with AHSA1/START domain